MNCKKCGYDAPFQALGYCYTCNQQKEFADKDVSKIIKGIKQEGQKESNGKLSYELHRPFITAMAKRMSQNKGKYPPYNRQKPMDIEELKQALFRHTIEVMNGNYTDNDELDHLSAIACNAQFIYYQLANQCTK